MAGHPIRRGRPNGAGKSTLFKAIVGVLKPLAGRIERDGFAAHDIAYLPQVADIDRSLPINVYDVVAMGLWRRKGVFGGIGRKDRAAVEAGIAAVELTGFEQRVIGTLSGGHAILPGVAIGFLLAGTSVLAMATGGLIAGRGGPRRRPSSGCCCRAAISTPDAAATVTSGRAWRPAASSRQRRWRDCGQNPRRRQNNRPAGTCS